MEVGIIGAGMIGGTLARLLVAQGHAVRIAARTHGSPRLRELPEGVPRVAAQEAAAFGVATIVAVPFMAWSDLARDLGDAFFGRVVIDTSNAFPARDSAAAEAALASGAGSGVAVAALLPGARIVKGFNTIHYATLAASAGRSPPIGIPLAGDDPAAVALAATLVAAAGFAPVPAGPLSAAAAFDAGTPLFNRALPERDLRRALFPDT